VLFVNFISKFTDREASIFFTQGKSKGKASLRRKSCSAGLDV